MLIGVMSDSHDRVPMIDAAVALFIDRGVEAVIHAGDFVSPFAVRRLLRFGGPLYAIYGNNDGERAGLRDLMPQVQDGPLWVTLGGRSVLVHHFLGWCDPVDIERAEIIIMGHTHEAVNRVENGRLFLNPGECGGWISGRCTVAVLNMDNLSAEICELES